MGRERERQRETETENGRDESNELNKGLKNTIFYDYIGILFFLSK